MYGLAAVVEQLGRRVALLAQRLTGDLLGEVLAEHCLLALITGPDLCAVEAIGSVEHVLECQLADGLAVLDHERDITRPYLERGSRAEPAAVLVIAEARVKE